MYPRMLDDVATLHPAPGKSVGGANNHNTGLVRRGAKPVNYGALSSLVTARLDIYRYISRYIHGYTYTNTNTYILCCDFM